MTKTLSIALICCMALLAPGRVVGEVFVNEVLVNEPNGLTSAEWFEVYNDSPSSSVSFAFYTLSVNGTEVTFSSTPTIDPGDYLIVCRSRISFEASYGDGSGTWGDHASEHGQLVQASSSFSLSNQAGEIVLLNAASIPATADTVRWSFAGEDNVSWERPSLASTILRQSLDPTGSTPGFVNSRSTVATDLGLEQVLVEPVEGGSKISFVVSNRGETVITDGQLDIFYVNSADTSDVSNHIITSLVPDLDTGYSVIISAELSLTGVYDTLGAVLEDDDRVRNNRLDFVAVGDEYPPVTLSEFLANPQYDLSGEWVEIANHSDDAFDIRGWRLGDQDTTYVISSTSMVIPSGQYRVLVKDISAFAVGYPDFSGFPIELDDWAALNNAGDVVRLVDAFGIEADRFEYASGFEDNHTWARTEAGSGSSQWGRSLEAGGTPGDSNSVRLAPGSEGLTVLLEPQIISPNGDGYDDVTNITVNGPAGAPYTIKIYDRQGREITVIEDGAEDLRPVYQWEGLSPAGNRLPVGIYILYVEAEGIESIKRTIVIAR